MYLLDHSGRRIGHVSVGDRLSLAHGRLSVASCDGKDARAKPVHGTTRVVVSTHLRIAFLPFNLSFFSSYIYYIHVCAGWEESDSPPTVNTVQTYIYILKEIKILRARKNREKISKEKK